MRGLDRSQIVEAALELLDRDGLAGVTTRRIAERLGVKSASLYWHIKDRDELIGLLSDRVVADARWPEPGAGWRETAEGLMSEYLRCLLAHRDAARVVAGRPPLGPNRLRGAEMLLKALLAGGLSTLESYDAALVLTTYVVGFALEQQASDESSPSFTPVTLPVDQYPTLAAMSELALRPGADRFGEGLRLLLDGIGTRLSSQRLEGAG